MQQPPATKTNTLDGATAVLNLTIEQAILPLVTLINALEIPPSFNLSAQRLIDTLESVRSVSAYSAVFEAYENFLQELKNHKQQEQKETTALLSSLTEQLTELGIKASGATHAAQLSAKQRHVWDQSVSAQMSDLEKSSSEATTLEHLKQLINIRLIIIRNEIKEHLINEEQQRQETERQLTELTHRLKTLDAESNELRTKLSAAYSKATRDTLTELPNRLAYEDTLPIEISRWQRYRTPLTMVIWDIDFFKAINDTYGHKAGDKILAGTANLLSKHCRKTDFVSRLGGEEFLMLLPNTGEQPALVFANKIRLLIEQNQFSIGDQSIHITLSCGISEFREGDTGESVFERADQALYHSKANGRNQCSIALYDPTFVPKKQ